MRLAKMDLFLPYFVKKLFEGISHLCKRAFNMKHILDD